MIKFSFYRKLICIFGEKKKFLIKKIEVFLFPINSINWANSINCVRFQSAPRKTLPKIAFLFCCLLCQREIARNKNDWHLYRIYACIKKKEKIYEFSKEYNQVSGKEDGHSINIDTINVMCCRVLNSIASNSIVSKTLHFYELFLVVISTY